MCDCLAIIVIALSGLWVEGCGLNSVYTIYMQCVLSREDAIDCWGIFMSVGGALELVSRKVNKRFHD